MNTNTSAPVDVLAARANHIPPGVAVSYQYRQHHLLGGALISVRGTVIDRTVVGTEDAYAIKPTDGSAVVHVRAAGVRSAI
jgi:hypothetical protein